MLRLALTCVCLATLLAFTSTAEARNLRRLQTEELAPPEDLAAPPQRVLRQSSQKTPFQAAQKYQPAQKGAYHKGHVATCVRYVQHRPLKKTCCGCGTSYHTTLPVYDPSTCCMIDVPVCLPSCCQEAPTASGRNGLLGRGITTFNWCCGYKVRIVATKHGDVTVHYYGS